MGNSASSSGLTGFPTNIYYPYCATACLRSLYTLTLNCSSQGVTVGMVTFATSTECYASNTPYLTSLAWCAHTKCADEDILPSDMEYFWEQQATGQKAAGVVAVPAKWSYAEALEQVLRPPELQLEPSDTSLNETSLVPLSVYQSQYNILYSVQREATNDNKFGIAILVAGFGIPVLLTWLGYVPGIRNILQKQKPYLLWPSIFRTYHIRPLPYLLGHVPTTGQSLYITIFVVLNLVLTSILYESRQPNAWYSTRWREIMAYILSRTGTLAYIMSPLIWLFATRNNVLLWLTDWSHSTFMVLHRWIARVYAVQVLVHSIVALVLYSEEGVYDINYSKPYWVWGIVATMAAVILTFGSGLHIRRFFYEAWLLVHILLAVILLVGCWYHAYDLYKFLGGPQVWLYATFAVWVFDRLARLARVSYVGTRRATVTALGQNGEYLRIDIPEVRWSFQPGHYAYFYFPAANPLRPWESHPFSIIPTLLLNPKSCKQQKATIVRDDSSNQSDPNDNPKELALVASRQEAVNKSHHRDGLVLFIKKGHGMTNNLHEHKHLLTLIEGPYPSNSMIKILQCERVLLLAGGIGITALLSISACHWNVKLCWSLKRSAACLLEELADVVDHVEDKEIVIDERLSFEDLLRNEAADAAWNSVGVVVSGPAQFCDDARAAVVKAARDTVGTTFELEVEAYSW